MIHNFIPAIFSVQLVDACGNRGTWRNNPGASLHAAARASGRQAKFSRNPGGKSIFGDSEVSSFAACVCALPLHG
jgi:hypothetical protein